MTENELEPLNSAAECSESGNEHSEKEESDAAAESCGFDLVGPTTRQVIERSWHRLLLSGFILLVATGCGLVITAHFLFWPAWAVSLVGLPLICFLLYFHYEGVRCPHCNVNVLVICMYPSARFSISIPKEYQFCPGCGIALEEPAERVEHLSK